MHKAKVLLTVIWWSLLILTIFADEDFLYKFNQHDYKVEFQRTDTEYFNPELMYYFNTTTFKYNRTQAAVNFAFKAKTDITKDETYLVIQAHKFMSNEYRHFPSRFQMKLCQAIKFNIGGFEVFETVAGVKNCVIKKDVAYTLPNFAPDESKFPPLIPSGSYMAAVNYQFKGVTFAFVKIYVKIFRPDKLE